MATVGGINFDVTGNSAQLQEELKKTLNTFQRFAKDGSRALNNVQSVMSTLGTGLAIGGIGAWISKTIEAQEQTGRFAERLGMSVKSLSELQYAAKANSMQVETLQNNLQRMSKTIQEASRGTGTGVDALNQLGISAAKLDQLKPDQQLSVLADAMRGLKTESERLSVATDLFGKSGAEMLDMMGEGSAGLNSMAKEAAAMGAVMTDAQVAAAKLADDSLDRMNAAVGGLSNQIAANLAPGFASMAEWAADMLPRAFITMKEVLIASFAAVQKGWEHVKFGFEYGIKAIQFGFSLFPAAIADYLIDPIASALQAITGISWMPESFKATMGEWAGSLRGVVDTTHNVTDAIGVDMDRIAADHQRTIAVIDDTATQMIGELEAEKAALNDVAQASTATVPTLESLAGKNQTVADTAKAAADALKLQKEQMQVVQQFADAGRSTISKATEAGNNEGVRQAEFARKMQQIQDENAQFMDLDSAVFEQQRLARLAQFNTEFNDRQAAFDAAHVQLGNNETLKQQLLDSYNQQNVASAATLEADLQGIRDAAAISQMELDKRVADNRRQTMMNSLSQAASLMDSKSRKMFEVGKAAAISSAIINTYDSATKSYNALSGIPIIGPALGAAAAAVAIASGMVQIQKIKSTKFGGGASGGGGYSGASAAGMSAQAPKAPAAVVPETITTQSTLNQGGPKVEVHIGSVNGTTKEEISKLFEKTVETTAVPAIQKYLDNDGVLIKKSHRNAIELGEMTA